MILDGERMAVELFGRPLDPREYLLASYPALEAVVPPLTNVVGTAAPLLARVNHGRWIASCDCGAPRDKVPTPGGVVFLGQPVVWCLRCQNGGTGRGWRQVAVPGPELRAQIAAVLLCRPHVEDRNWEPSETVAELLAQNREHGDPAPDLAAVVAGPRQTTGRRRRMAVRLGRR